MSLGDEYSGRAAGRKQKRSGIRPFLPLLGLLLAVAMGVIAYFLSPSVLSFLASRFANIDTGDQKMKLVVTGAIFLVLMGFSAVIIAAATPKKKTNKLATEAVLKKEKQEKQKEVLAAKQRKRQIQKKVFEENKRKAEEEAKKRAAK
jgi:hypothetical protein